MGTSHICCPVPAWSALLLIVVIALLSVVAVQTATARFAMTRWLLVALYTISGRIHPLIIFLLLLTLLIRISAVHGTARRSPLPRP